VAARFRIALTGLFAVLCMLLGTPHAAAASTPARIAIDSGTTAGGSTSYRLHVESEGSPVLALLPDEVRAAELIVNGAVVQRAGRDVDLGVPPFGHAGSVFWLAGLTPGDRIEILQHAATGSPTILDDSDHLGMVFDAALWSGIGYGILFTLVAFVLATVLASGERTMLWYVLWLGAFISILLTRDGLLPLPAGAGQATLALANVVALVAYVGFASAFLELRARAPRMFRFFVVANVVFAASPGLVGVITHERPSIDVIFLANACAMALGMTIAALRRRAGFEPASYLAVGLVGTLILFIGRPLGDFAGIDSAFLDRWAAVILSVFDFLVFSLGIACRFRFNRREHELMKDELHATNLAAGRDPLTGLLNRRGLEEWMRSLGHLSGTVLFIDLDGFKAVNDCGGHAAGDRTLTAVARIMRHCVRAQDATARFGGDEFVVVLADCDDSEITQSVVTRITSAIRSLAPLGAENGISIGASIGCAHIDESGSFAGALECADADAYKMKQLHHARAGFVDIAAPPGTPHQSLTA
jgi:diguanylate cyclase (GGDEF)-like protein